MTSDELKRNLHGILEQDAIGVMAYVVLKSNNGYSLKKLDITNKAEERLIEAVGGNIRALLYSLEENDEYRVIALSAADDRTTAIYQYDLDQRPSFFDSFDEILSHRENDYFIENNQRVFDFSNDSLTEIDGVILEYGSIDNSILIYRKNYPVNLFKQDRIFLTKYSDTRLKAIENDFLRIDTKIDFFRIGDNVLIYNLDALEKYCEFHQIIKAEATRSLGCISHLNILENLACLEERLDELPFARKLTKISTTSPVFNLPKRTIIDFARQHALLGSKLHFTGNDTIVLQTKKEQNLFVRLLNDDFLHSQLTDFDYMTPAKDKL